MTSPASRPGPCLDAGGVVLRIDDMCTEQRWPANVARVRETGVRSSLSLPYQVSSIGPLDMYATEPSAFATPESLAAAQRYNRKLRDIVAGARDAR